MIFNTNEINSVDELRSLIHSIIEDRDKNDVDDEGAKRRDIAKLGPSASNIDIINKINEIINDFNKTLRDYRI